MITVKMIYLTYIFKSFKSPCNVIHEFRCRPTEKNSYDEDWVQTHDLLHGETSALYFTATTPPPPSPFPSPALPSIHSSFQLVIQAFHSKHPDPIVRLRVKPLSLCSLLDCQCVSSRLVKTFIILFVIACDHFSFVRRHPDLLTYSVHSSSISFISPLLARFSAVPICRVA